MLKILLISFLFAFSLPSYQFVMLKNGVYVKNHTNRYLYCYIGGFEFKVKPKSNSRVYPHSDKKVCR